MRATLAATAFLALSLAAGVYLLVSLASRLAEGWAQRPTPPLPPTEVIPTPYPTRPRVLAATATRISAPPASPAPVATTPPALPEAECEEGLRDGGFEGDWAWDIAHTAYTAGYVNRPAAYVSDPVRGGQRALRLGIPDGPDIYSYSAAGQQVSIPADAASVRLSLWLYPQSADQAGDGQYLLLLKPGGGYDTLVWELANSETWQYREFSLDAYRGQTVTVHLEVHNDGDGARTALYVDDVSLSICY